MEEPGILDLLEVRLDNGLRLPYLTRGKTYVDGQVYRGREPELRFSVEMRHVHVDSRLLAEKNSRNCPSRTMVGAMERLYRSVAVGLSWEA
jgi:hypothetical protein